MPRAAGKGLRNLLDKLDNDRIVEAIRSAESRSTGEIRVHISGRKVKDVQAAAARRFEKLGMAATRQRNGVLLYVAPRVARFAVLGDTAIHDKCGDDFWREVAGAVETEFRGGRFTEGIVRGVERLGEVLAQHFPPPAGQADANELPDRPTWG
ncbi:MAG: TPM domain-containing protein [Actinomycetota bacterium]